MFSLRKILKYVWPETRGHRLAFFLVFLFYGLAVLLDNIFKPYIYKEIVDSITLNSPSEIIIARLLFLIGIVAIVVLINTTFYRLGDFTNAYFESKVMKKLHDSTLHKLLEHSYSFFTSNFSGSLVAKAKRFVRAFEALQDILSFQIWFSFLGVVGIVIVLLFQVPILGLIFLAWSLIYLGVIVLFIRKTIRLEVIEASADSLVTAHLADTITNILNVKIFTGRQKEEASFAKATADEEIKRRRAWFFINLQNAVQAGLMAILQIAVLYLTIRLWSDGRLSVGTFVLIQTYLMGLFDVLWNLGRSLTRAIKSLSDMKEVVDIFEITPGIIDVPEPEISLISKGEIVFDQVDFEYVKAKVIFNNFNLKIKAGEKVGLVGHSGSGKSTLVKMLLRFADIRGGQILIDGQDITKIKQDDLRSKISHVPQESILFHRSIRDNIAYSNSLVAEEEIIEAAKKAHAHEFISGFKNGYETLVGERGIKLSGGEKQRVAIARAMLKPAPILILDEATSSLDSVSESYIQDAFNALMKGKTTIVIAHRLSTIQKMDRIIVLDKGKIVEEGTHRELLERDGVYADLWEHQTGGFLNSSTSQVDELSNKENKS